jgi:peptidoglycan/LPS O-acetylase OafA/YrhL
MNDYFLDRYPVATVSSLAFYVFLVLLFIPGFRQRAAALFAHPAPPQAVHLGALDAFRGFAALLVAIAHCWWFTYPVFAKTQLAAPWLGYAGNKAVPIFAVLSGFLIYRSIRNARTLTDFRVFVARRFFRIYPLYAVSVLACLWLGQTETEVAGVERANFLVAEFFMFKIFTFPVYSNPVTWSLYVEIIFYLMMPAFIAVMRPRENPLAVPVYVLIMLALLIADQIPGRELQLWKYFFFGIISAELSILYKNELGGWIGKVTLASGATLLFFDMIGPKFDVFFLLGLTKKNLAEYTIGLGLATALVAASAPHVRLVSALLDVLPFRMLGAISYSVFLMHPFYILMNFPEFVLRKVGQQVELWKTYEALPAWYLPFVFLPGVLIWSMITFLLIERPALKYGMRLTQKWRAEDQAALKPGGVA